MSSLASWIKRVPYAEATGKLKTLYDRIRGPDGHIDNIMSVHSLRPHTLEGHMALYKNVLHHSANTLPTSLLEIIGVYVSLLNGCSYCVEHHYAGLSRLLGDEARALEIRTALESNRPHDALEARETAILTYAEKLTETPAELTEEVLEPLYEVGLDDGEILEINQVVSYFAYANRTVLGLGVTTEGDLLGLSPNDTSDETNWQHG